MGTKLSFTPKIVSTNAKYNPSQNLEVINEEIQNDIAASLEPEYLQKEQ